MTQEALNIAGQCRATASSPLAKNISVDEGNGLLTELLLDAAKVIEALAQPEQEPVAWIERDIQCDDFDPDSVRFEKPRIAASSDREWVPLYTTPPQRTWVGLTNKERAECWETIPELAMQKVEAKLKEKNT